jgi:hypothetical protein
LWFWSVYWFVWFFWLNSILSSFYYSSSCSKNLV